MMNKRFLSVVSLILVSGMLVCSAVGCKKTDTIPTDTKPASTNADTSKVTTPETKPATTPETKPETEPETDPVVADVTIGTADELVAFATSANDGTEDYTGVTIKLTTDIDLKDIAWTPIAGAGITDAIIDGDGHTISNMTIIGADGEGQLGFVGLVDEYEAVTIQNLTFENCVVTSSGRHNGIVIGEIVKGYASVANVTVKNCEIKGATGNDQHDVEEGANLGNLSIRQGAIAGMVQTGGSIDIDRCTVDGFTVTGFHNVAGLIGYLEPGQTHVTNNVVKNVVLNFSAAYAYSYANEEDTTGHGRRFTNVFYNLEGWINHEEDDKLDGNTYENVKAHDILNNVDYDGFTTPFYNEPEA